MRKPFLLSLLLTMLFNFSVAQKSIGFVMKGHKAKVTIPFSLINNLVIIPVTINNKVTLKYIVDTGANNPILTERVFADILGLNYDRTILISGPGIEDSIGAHVANQVSLSIAPDISGNYLSMLVLEEDYIELKKNLGEDIYGIIGYEVFNRFIVKIDYDNLELTFYDPSKFKRPKNYSAFRLELDNTKPYINSLIKQNNQVDTVRLMVDTGASHALLLDIEKSDVLILPDSTLETSLGHGLGGEIPGRIGRFSEFQMGYYKLSDVLVSIPDNGAYSNSIKRGSRNGTVGGAMWKRFNPIIDYFNGYIYLKKSSFYGDPFSYDMSGLRISYLENPDRMEITGLTPNSPAEEAGLQVGDIVNHINGKNIMDSKLSEMYSLLKRREKKKIKVQVERNQKTMEFTFRLRKMI